MIYDCIIVGGGPAGSVCAYLLAKAGYRCLILEKRSEIDEKICGGFLPNRAREYLLDMGLDLSETLYHDAVKVRSCMTVKGDREHCFTYDEEEFGIGTFRKNLDQYLLNQAVSQGAEISFSTEVREVQQTEEAIHVQGYSSKTIVFAAGASGHRKINIFRNEKNNPPSIKNTLGISEIIRGSSNLVKDRVYFWYEDVSTMDYFWAIPVSHNTWNIGLWCQIPEKNMKKRFYELRKKYIDSNFTDHETLRVPTGALCGNVNNLPYRYGRCLGAGDFCGTNRYESGEGLYHAIVSAKETAELIMDELRNYM
ncbi:MAG: NAD(P)/FAD-dependent oxidoreductase [Oliverpabstia sp.]